MCKNKLLFSGAFSNKIGQHHLLFVRRTCILLQRGKVFAADALLGRFLPRLGPPVATQAASLVPLLRKLIQRQRDAGRGALLRRPRGRPRLPPNQRRPPQIYLPC
jgi:hypothetical protein